MNNNWQYDYSNLYNNPNNQPGAPVQGQPPIMPMQPAPKKHPGRGKRVIAAVLLVALCGGVSVGGGYLGTVLASQKNVQTTTQSAALPATPPPSVASATGSLSVADVAAIAGPSVVEVATESVTTNNFFGQFVQSGAGSGVIISEDGYIVTNSHVVSGAEKIKVTLHDKTEYDAAVIGSDAKTDIALLKVEAKGLTPATIGNSENLSVGEFTLAVGNPLGRLGGTVTDGIISALNRDITIDSQTMNLMQTNAAVSPGNSGGGLFNARGELIGIVNAKSGGDGTEGLGFAIPINTAMNVVNELKTNGYVTGRPVMGITVIAIDDLQTAMQYGVSNTGVYVQSVSENSPAEKAGIEVGDLFISVDGAAISTKADVTGMLSNHKVGDVVEVQMMRERQVLTLRVTLSEQQAPETAKRQVQNP
ncbi:MAG: trypsin-like peptidase domain-containing protein [Ruthenibacterium sp.]